ncbi:MAG: hypothetical protein ACYCSG_07250 [Thermoplasmataceae archaeon]
MSKKRIFILGLGAVGKNLLLNIKNNTMNFNFDEHFRIIGAADSRCIILAEEGISPEKLLSAKMEGDLENAGSKTGVLPSPDEVDILIDASTASKDGLREMNIYKDFLLAGKSVVTSNKSPLANFWPELMNFSKEGKGNIFYESTVCGGLPLFNMVRYSLHGMKIMQFSGIVNLTANYILEIMRRGGRMDEAIQDAIMEGFAETDYSDDVTGLDSARKSIIISNSLFGTEFRLRNLKYEGITPNIEFENGLRKMLLSTVTRRDDEIVVESRIRNVNKNENFYILGPKSMAYELKPSGRSAIFVSEDFDGPVETSLGVLSDIITLA